MKTTLLNFQITDWTGVAAIVTIIACIAGIAYTIITYKIFKQNSNTNQLAAYLSIRKELTSEVFTLFTNYCRLDSITIDDSLTKADGYVIGGGNMTITRHIFLRDILGNIEDLALFYEKKLLTMEMIDSGYGYPLLYIGNNITVREFIKRYRDSGQEVYCGFEKLYNKIYDQLDGNEKNKFCKRLVEQSERKNANPKQPVKPINEGEATIINE